MTIRLRTIKMPRLGSRRSSRVVRALLLVTSLGYVLAGLATPLAASAATAKPLNLITSPLPINLETDPGKTVSTDLRVKQSGGDTERLKVGLMKFTAFGNEGKPRLLDRAPGDDYFDWVKFDKTQFTAPSDVWQTVHMTINVPKTAAFGYYYAVVFSRAGDDAPQAGHTNALNGGTAVLVLLDARVPNAKRSMELVSFSTDHRVYEFLPTSFNVHFKNTGNVHLVPHGNIFVMSGKKQIAALNLNDEQGNILPSSNRIYPVDWSQGFPHYEPVVQDGKVKLDKNQNQVRQLIWTNGKNQDGDDGSGKFKIRFGRYTAHLFAVYDDGQRDVPLEAEISFWVIPWRFLLAVLVIVLLVGFGIYVATRGIWRGARRGASRLSGANNRSR